MSGGSGTDHIYGEGGNDRLYGGPDDDGLYGGFGDDVLDARGWRLADLDGVVDCGPGTDEALYDWYDVVTLDTCEKRTST